MLIYTGRFQPFHNGHLHVVDYLSRTYPKEVICIAIIKDYPFRMKKTSFDKRVDIEIAKNVDFMNSEATLQSITSVLRNKEYNNVVTTIMPRASRESWDVIKKLFDCQRTWVFTKDTLNIDLWEDTKSGFYSSLGENILYVPIAKTIDGTEIREHMIKGEYMGLSSIVPEEIIDYYSSKSEYKEESQ